MNCVSCRFWIGSIPTAARSPGCTVPYHLVANERLRLCSVSLSLLANRRLHWVTDGGFPCNERDRRVLRSLTLLVVRRPRPGGSRCRHAGVGLDSPSGPTRTQDLLLSRCLYGGRSPLCGRPTRPVPLPGDISAIGLLLALLFRQRLIARTELLGAHTTNDVPHRAIRRCCGHSLV